MLDQTLRRIRAEFLEMPRMSLTREQAQRLCGIETAVCQQVLDSLVEENFLYVKPNGAYARVGEGGADPKPYPAKAGLRTKAISA